MSMLEDVLARAEIQEKHYDRQARRYWWGMSLTRAASFGLIAVAGLAPLLGQEMDLNGVLGGVLGWALLPTICASIAASIVYADTVVWRFTSIYARSVLSRERLAVARLHAELSQSVSEVNVEAISAELLEALLAVRTENSEEFVAELVRTQSHLRKEIEDKAKLAAKPQP